MQRRLGAGRGSAHIKPPAPMLRDEKHPSASARLQGRNLNRIWLFVIALVCVLAVSHFIWPSFGSPSTPLLNYSNADLKAKNYFNLTESGPNPFSFCPNYGPGDELGLKYGALMLSKSRIHLGSGGRIQRVLNQALAGQPVTISVLGGSISACHGAGDDPISPKCYPSKFFQWWNSVFPHPASELTNGAMRRTNAGYFAFCNAHHLPDLTDLVIIELDTDDPPGQEMMENFETLIRSILLRPSQPAVLLLGHFSPQIHSVHGYAGPDHWHSIVAQFYDVPHITSKALLFPSYMRDPNSINPYFADPILASVKGHDMLRDVLVAYMQSQICTAWNVAHGRSFDAVPLHTGMDTSGGKGKGKGKGTPGENHALFGGVGQRKGVPEEPGGTKDGEGEGEGDTDATAAAQAAAQAAVAAEEMKLKAEFNAKEALAHHALLSVPPGRINTRPNSGRPFEEIAPFCVSANDLINPLPPSHFYGSGWFAWHPSGSGGGGGGGGGALSTAAHYWHSTLPTSKIRIPIQVGAGDIGVYFLKEPVKDVGEGSAVECWVDDNYGGAKVIENAGDVGEVTPELYLIDKFVSRGSHFVECQLLGEEGQGVPSFKIIGIFAT